MLGAGLVAVFTAIVAGLVYLKREAAGVAGVGMAALRTVAMTALALLFLNPVMSQDSKQGPPTVLLDASLSMNAVGGRWEEAVSIAAQLAAGGPDGGVVLRFGNGLQAFDSTPPTDGSSRVLDALKIAHGRPGPVVIVTDGEVEDVGALPPTLIEGVGIVTVPRDTQPNLALLDVEVPARVHERDSVFMTVVIGSWGAVQSDSATVEVAVDGRMISRKKVELPPPPGVARRSFTIPPGRMASGTNVLRIGISASASAPGDGETEDNERLRLVTVTASPGIVVLVAPADIEGRFLVETLRDFAQTPVSGFARVQPGRWIDMDRGRVVAESTVRAEVFSADVVVLRGPERVLPPRQGPVWIWPGAVDPLADFAPGDWYPVAAVPPSPLAGRLTRIAWDSLPPVTGLVPIVPGDDEWTVLTARLSRRGAERPLIIGYDSSGVRRLVTASTGLWRWSLRGGAPREAYRAVLAAGVDWLLDTGERHGMVLTATSVTTRGQPIVFRWLDESPPDSLELRITGDSVTSQWLRFDATGRSQVFLEPGVYNWRAPAADGAQGVAVVEPYSDEFHLKPVFLSDKIATGGVELLLFRARHLWWLFALSMIALLGEWAWRQRHGLP